jgi:hypothetical protein
MKSDDGFAALIFGLLAAMVLIGPDTVMAYLRELMPGRTGSDSLRLTQAKAFLYNEQNGLGYDGVAPPSADDISLYDPLFQLADPNAPLLPLDFTMNADGSTTDANGVTTTNS